jgi:hypothetical protein
VAKWRVEQGVQRVSTFPGIGQLYRQNPNKRWAFGGKSDPNPVKKKKKTPKKMDFCAQSGS